MDYLDKAQSLGEMFQGACAYWRDKTALLYPVKGVYQAYSYRMYYERVYMYAKIIHNLGLQKGDRLALFAETSFEWGAVDWAAQTLGVVLVPIYPTLPQDQARYIVQDSGSKVLIVGTLELKKRYGDDGKTPIYVLKAPEGEETFESLSSKSLMHRPTWEEGMKQFKADDLATIIYTSGTTGNPKGVMLTNENFLSLCRDAQKSLPVGPDDVFLSFLPLSHVYERFAGHIMPISQGCTIGYVQSINTFASDMLVVKPTIMLCVPRFLESMRNKIVDNAAKQSPIKQFLFRLAHCQGLKKFHKKFAPFYSITDAIVATKIRERTGGRLRFFVSGGAALAPHVEEFFESFGIRILQGYGLTETCAFSFLGRLDDSAPGTVGRPATGLEVKIDEDGEILLRGASVMKGYYNLPQETQEVIDQEGWFHTGDIGTWVGPNLKITDRKKDLLVLGNGKNVAPQPIENRIKESEFIEEVVLFGDGMEHVCALIIPNKDLVVKWAAGENLGVQDWAQLLARPETKLKIKKEIDKINRELASFEKVKKFEMIPDTFSIETGELTPSLKVKRKVVKEKYADVLRKMQRPEAEV